ncbi:polysaccharide deacetylase family protein [Streptomyces libani]
MDSDRHTRTRRKFLQAAVVVGALSAARVLFSSDGGAPETGPRPSTPTRPTQPPATSAGPPLPAEYAGPASAPGPFRLRPMAGETSRSGPGASPPHPDVAFRLSTDRREIFLTFDDGPHPAHTPEILRILRRHDTRATFFVIGENALEFPDLLRALADDGHAVANHTWTHPQLTTLPPGLVRSELGRTSDLIEDVLGTAPDLARAPYGDWDETSLSICNALGMSPVGWAVDYAGLDRPRRGDHRLHRPGRDAPRGDRAVARRGRRAQPDRRGTGLVSAAAAGRRLSADPYRALTRGPRGAAGPVTGGSGHQVAENRPNGLSFNWKRVPSRGCRTALSGKPAHRRSAAGPEATAVAARAPRNRPGRIPPFGRGFPVLSADATPR